MKYFLYPSALCVLLITNYCSAMDHQLPLTCASLNEQRFRNFLTATNVAMTDEAFARFTSTVNHMTRRDQNRQRIIVPIRQYQSKKN